MSKLQRIIIHGHLTATSELHPGDGEQPTLVSRDPNSASGYYNSVATGIDQTPYLAGSSLRGAVLDGIHRDDDANRQLFGHSDDKTDDKRHASRVRLHDARLDRDATAAALGNPEQLPNWSAQRMTLLRHGIELDNATGSVARGKLFQHELIAHGSVFDWRIELDRPRDGELARLLGLLQRLDDSPWSAIGRGRSKGLGRIRWHCTRIHQLTTDELTRWLGTEAKGPPPLQPLLEAEWPAATPPGIATGSSLALKVRALAPLLVNEPARVSGAEGAPKLEFSRTRDGRALVPGSSVKGLVRAHCSRILASIAHLHYHTPPEQAAASVLPLVEALFGGERRRAVLWFDDLVSDQPATRHHQFFNAIDRFTGGVKDSDQGGALFNVVAAGWDPAKHRDTLSSHCHLDTARLPEGDWWKGLLLLLTRDAMEDRLAAGWGKAKGYGVLRYQPEAGDWPTLLDSLRADGHDPAAWITALHAEVAAAAVNNTAQPTAA